MRWTILHSEIIERAAWRIARLAITVNFLMRSCIVVASFVASTFSAQADMRITRDSEMEPSLIAGALFVDITGTITNRDAEKFQEMSKELEYASVVIVDLDSTSGDVSAAVRIGRLVRKYEVWTSIPHSGKCYSSCALIFIAGVQRSSDGELGVHRPYVSSAPQGGETLEKHVAFRLSMIKSYIGEMGVSNNFYQRMVNTEPPQMVIYAKNDYAAMLPLEDPVHDEMMIARLARKYGVTTSTLRQRSQDVGECAPKSLDSRSNAEALVDCMEAIRWGLDERVYLERDAKSKKECWYNDKMLFSESESAIIATTPSKLRMDLPLTIRRETCVRSIMLGRNTPEQTSRVR